MARMSDPVVCPHCHKVPNKVQVARTLTLTYNAETGVWEQSLDQDLVLCFLCGKVIGTQDEDATFGIYPDGILWC